MVLMETAPRSRPEHASGVSCHARVSWHTSLQSVIVGQTSMFPATNAHHSSCTSSFRLYVRFGDSSCSRCVLWGQHVRSPACQRTAILIVPAACVCILTLCMHIRNVLVARDDVSLHLQFPLWTGIVDVSLGASICWTGRCTSGQAAFRRWMLSQIVLQWECIPTHSGFRVRS